MYIVKPSGIGCSINPKKEQFNIQFPTVKSNV